jgi:hypothetical protein
MNDAGYSQAKALDKLNRPSDASGKKHRPR